MRWFFAIAEHLARFRRLGTRRARPFVVLTLALVLSVTLGTRVRRAEAATTTVQVGQQNGGTTFANQYNPAFIVIGRNDTVHWTWFSGLHTVTSYSESTPGVPDWQSAINSTTTTFDRMFGLPGVVTYYCSIHALRSQAAPANIDANIAAGFMVGKIVVPAPVGGIAQTPNLSASGRDRGRYLLFGAGAAAAAIILAGSAAWYARGRRM